MHGDRSIGVFAQSLGVGGIVDRLFADIAGGAGMSGAVSLSLVGNVLADGQDGVAVFAQSRGANGQGDIKMTLAKDKMIFAGQNGVGVLMSGGVNNNFTNHGTISTEDGLQGWAARAEGGNNVIDNYGTFYGQFDLEGHGTNRFVNHAGNLFVPGAALMLGNSSNLLVNDGIMMPGGSYRSLETHLSGSFLQSSTGISVFDLDLGSGNIDSVLATGTASLAGAVDVTHFNEELVKPGHFNKTFYSGALGLTNNGISLTTQGTSVITYDPLIITPTMASLGYLVDFSPNGFNAQPDFVRRLHQRPAVGRRLCLP